MGEMTYEEWHGEHANDICLAGSCQHVRDSHVGRGTAGRCNECDRKYGYYPSRVHNFVVTFSHGMPAVEFEPWPYVYGGNRGARVDSPGSYRKACRPEKHRWDADRPQIYFGAWGDGSEIGIQVAVDCLRCGERRMLAWWVVEKATWKVREGS